jgi:DNA-binding MurR/RpiR family transcriptional regulator
MDAESVVDESLYARATRIGPELPGVLGQVATFFALHPDRVAGLPVQDIAAAIGTSDASVIRTAKALGYSGMKAARQAAVELVNQRANPGAILQRRMNSTTDGSHLRQVASDTAHAVEQFTRQIDEIDWDGVVTAVADADRVFCYGLSPTGYVADYLAFILARIGVDARSSRVTGVLLADELAQLRAGTTVIVFAPVRQFDEVAATVRTAKAVGAAVVLITEAIGMPVRNEVDYVVTTSPTSLTSASDAGIPLLVAQALMTAVAARHASRALASMDRLNQLRPTLTRLSVPLTAERLGIPTTDDETSEE